MRPPLRAEFLKQSGQRGLIFWGFLAVPLAAILVAVVLELSMARALADGTAVQVHPLRSAMRALAVGGNPIAQLFFAIGAAALFVVEYRYACWRHVVPRCSRRALMLAKAGIFGAFAAGSLLLLGVGDLLASLIMPILRGVPLSDTAPATPAGLLLSWLTSWTELMALAGTVALMAVITRSNLGAILPPFLLSLGASLAESFFTDASGVPAPLPLPTFAADAIRAWIWAQGEESAATATGATIGAAVLTAWTAATFGAALAIFERQDLAQE